VDLIELPPLKGNLPVTRNALQLALAPHVSAMQIGWWVVWVAVLICVIGWFVVLPNGNLGALLSRVLGRWKIW
jgi:hypothetical protein